MNTKIISTFILALGLVFSVHRLHGQIAPYGIYNGGPVQSAQSDPSDSIVQLTADAQGLSWLAPDQVPFSGTFWTIVPGSGLRGGVALPFPCPPPGQLPTYALPGGSFLVDDTATTNPVTQADLEAQAATVVGLVDQGQAAVANDQPHTLGRAMDVGAPPSPGGGGGTNTYNPDDLTNNFVADYGANLWLEITSLSNVWVNLLVSNTVADAQYEIDGTTNLAPFQWNFEGFFYGSELTNWTPTTVAAFTYKTNLFLRVKAWQSSDGTGLPDWWELEYFGYLGVDPYGDPTGDGWSNLQKFQNGMNPTNFYTPTAPQGVTVSYNTNGTATISWLPSPGDVTGYTVTDSEGNTFTFAADTTSFVDTNVDGSPFDLYDDGPTIGTSISVQANYGSHGASAASNPAPLEQNSLSAAIVPKTQGSAYLVVSALPANTATISISVVDEATLVLDELEGGDLPTTYTNFSLPISSFTNGMCILPNTAMPADADGWSVYYWFGQAIGTNGIGVSAATLLTEGYNDPQGLIAEELQIVGFSDAWPVAPFFDGRLQLKQNLTFQLRAAVADRPFQYSETQKNLLPYAIYYYSDPADYAYAGFYWKGNLDAFLPFEENTFDANFVFNPANLDADGVINTGVGGEFDYNGELDIQIPSDYEYDPIDVPMTYQFAAPTVNGVAMSALLATNETRWLASYPVASSSAYLWEIGVTNDPLASPPINAMYNASNWFGLHYLSTKLTYGSATETLYPGDYTTNGGSFYPETDQPKFGVVGYDCWQCFNGTALTPEGDFPGLSAQFINHTNPLLITSVGNSGFQVACYAKLAVTNAYPGVYGYLEQYFDQAYEFDPNGNATTNTTGILSSYGNFFATQPGPVALVTMPDIDTGEQGTCTVYAVSLQLDANHDGNMDLSYNGADATSPSKPMQFWINNNFDRSLFSPDDGTNIDDDALPSSPAAGCPYTSKATPDCNYLNGGGQRVIPCARDLEDFARLWVCGITPDLLSSLSIDSTVALSWGDVGSPNTNNPTIDLFQAADVNGGMGYLTNSSISALQTNSAQSAYVARLGPGTSVNLTGDQFSNNWAGSHFIWCGVAPGLGQLQLTITDGHSNVLAQTSVSIQIQDIKYMYERWTVGDAITNAPTSTVHIAEDDLANTNLPGFQFAAPGNGTTPYILFAHGWNMTMYDKDRFAEAAFKRLYWQGYQGRFGSFQWPTGNGFGGSAWDVISQSRNFDNSEYRSWQSGVGLTNLLTQLDAEYPNNVHLIAHSMGNVVAGEALRLANRQLVKTYISMEGAIASHAYDPTTVTRPLVYLGVNLDRGTPDRFAYYFTDSSPCYFNTDIGAGTYVNFYNTNDYALNKWTIDQDVKPDHGLTSYPGYQWSSSSGFYVIYGPGVGQTIYLNFPTNTYEIFALCDEARCFALGAQANVEGVFGGSQIDLHSVWPPDPLTSNPQNLYSSHFWHSAEFRGDYLPQMNFWKAILGPNGLNLQ